MKTTINEKRYNSDNCETLGKITHYNNGNYAGNTNLLRAKDGMLLVQNNSNGQDCYFTDCFYPLSHSHLTMDDFELTEEEEKRLVELGLITII
jgi:hypothetical protein